MLKHRGFGLLEVLLATIILTCGLFGIYGLYLRSFKYTADAYWRVLATSQWVAMMEQQDNLLVNCATWSAACEKVLPGGKCKCDSENITVCWRGKYCISNN